MDLLAPSIADIILFVFFRSVFMDSRISNRRRLNLAFAN